MVAPSLPPALRAELTRLRQRAYGPSADIRDDPTAVARLTELERAAAGGGTPGPVGADEPPSGSTGRSGPPPASARFPRRMLVIAGTLVIAAIVVAWILIAAQRPDATMTGTMRTLADDDAINASWIIDAWGIEPDRMRAYVGVEGITVWAGSSDDEVHCMLVASDDNFIGIGCSRDGLDPTVDALISAPLVDPDTTGVAARTTMRFVSRGDHVDVWISPAPAVSRG